MVDKQVENLVVGMRKFYSFESAARVLRSYVVYTFKERGIVLSDEEVDVVIEKILCGVDAFEISAKFYIGRINGKRVYHAAIVRVFITGWEFSELSDFEGFLPSFELYIRLVD